MLGVRVYAAGGQEHDARGRQRLVYGLRTCILFLDPERLPANVDAVLNSHMKSRREYYWYEGDPRPKDFWDIRKRFRALRQKAKLTQHKLGEIIRLCRKSISQIENGHVIPHPSSWLRFRQLERKHLAPPINFPTNWWNEDA